METNTALEEARQRLIAARETHRDLLERAHEADLYGTSEEVLEAAEAARLALAEVHTARQAFHRLFDAAQQEG